jgi:hypothetical protein
MAYPNPTAFTPVEVATFTATATTATNDFHEFTMTRPVKNVIAQIQAATTGAVNTAGLAVTITTVTDTSCKVKVAATAITAGDVINVVAW